MIRPTQRTYTEKTSGEKYRMFEDVDEKSLIMINIKNGGKITLFYCCAFTSIDLKLKNKEVIHLDAGEFLKIDKNNPPTHKKFFIQKRFRKL